MHASSLPVSSILPQLHQALDEGPVVLQAPPGAGKSTLLPWSLLQRDATSRWILVQPRRLAALSIANFLASQLDEPVGQRVGFQIRQQAKRSRDTRLLVVTEGILTRMLQTDPELAEFDGVIFDEFHERNLHSDLGLALVLETLQLRDDLKLLVMSATLPADALANWLKTHGADAQIVHSEGRQHPIEVDYRPRQSSGRGQAKSGPRPNYVESAASTVVDIVLNHPTYRGILVFLPGQGEIQQALDKVNAQLGTREDVTLMALHGGLTLAQQQRATAPIRQGDARRVIFATNIAETSLTIDGIDWVIDSGRERQAVYRPGYQISELVTRRIARAAAIQRAGRAGRTGPGRCTRLYSESEWQGMADYRPADIEQQDLTNLVLQVACWGSTPDQLAWFSAPNSGHVDSAYQWLGQLGAVQPSGQVTPYGQALAKAGGEVRYAHALLQSEHDPVLAQAVCVLIALDEAREQRQTDLLSAVEAFLRDPSKLPKSQQRMQFWLAQRNLQSPQAMSPQTLIHAALLVWPLGLAKRRSGGDGYQLASGVGVEWPSHAHGNCTAAPWLVVSAVSLHEGQRNGRIQQAAAIPAELLGALFEGPLRKQLTYEQQVRWRAGKGSLVAVQVTAYHKLIIREQESTTPPTTDQRNAALCDYVRQHGLACMDWDDASIQWVRRVTLWDGFHDRAPRFADEQLLATLEAWAVPFWTDIRTPRDLSNWKPYSALLQLLDYGQQQELEHQLPRRWTAPSGRSHAILYQPDGSALVSLKLQEVFGASGTPTLLHGSLRLTLDLLSPAGRPLQRTSDLAGFWQGAYTSVKKEMRGRYPKHPWPDDPTAATATHLTKRAFNG